MHEGAHLSFQTIPRQLFFSSLLTGEHEFACYVELDQSLISTNTLIQWRIADAHSQSAHITCRRHLTADEQSSCRVWIAVTLPPSWPTSHLQLEVQTTGGLYHHVATIAHYRQSQAFQLPLSGQVLVLIGHRIGETHRAAWQVPTQHFAWDMLPLHPDGLRLLNGSLNEPLDATLFSGFGQDVLAPASGQVVQVVDRFPDGMQIGSYPQDLPFYLEDRRRAAGNHIILDHGGGVFSCLAHLQHGSICVQEREVVSSGQTIGRLGNSGFSSGPHLHVHFMDGPDLILASALPIQLQAEGSTFAPQAGQIIGP